MGMKETLKKQAVEYTKQFKDIDDVDRKNLMMFLNGFINFLDSSTSDEDKS